MADELHQLVASLQAEVRSLRQEVTSLRLAVESPPPEVQLPQSGSSGLHRPVGGAGEGQPQPVADLHDAPAVQRLERRSLLSGGAAALAGTVAAASAAVLANPAPAAAANGDAVTCGQTRTASAATELRYNGGGMSDWNLLTVQDTTNTQTNFPSAICGMASSDVSYGVQGYSSVDTAAGVLAYGGSQAYGLHARGGRANISMRLAGQAPQLRADSHVAGELLTTSGGDLWFCVASGTPGSWRRLSGADTVGSLRLLDQAVRVYDSRPNLPPLGVAKGILDSAERIVDCQFGGNGADEGSKAVLVNLTVVNTSSAGWMALFEAGQDWPGTSTLNWFQSGSVVANIAIVRCSVQALITAKVNLNSSTHFIVDLLGFFI